MTPYPLSGGAALLAGEACGPRDRSPCCGRARPGHLPAASPAPRGAPSPGENLALSWFGFGRTSAHPSEMREVRPELQINFRTELCDLPNVVGERRRQLRAKPCRKLGLSPSGKMPGDTRSFNASGATARGSRPRNRCVSLHLPERVVHAAFVLQDEHAFPPEDLESPLHLGVIQAVEDGVIGEHDVVRVIPSIARLPGQGRDAGAIPLDRIAEQDQKARPRGGLCEEGHRPRLAHAARRPLTGDRSFWPWEESRVARREVGLHLLRPIAIEEVKLLPAPGSGSYSRMRLKGSAEPPRRSAALGADPDEVGRSCGPTGRALGLLRQRSLLSCVLPVRPRGSGGLHASMLTGRLICTGARGRSPPRP